LLDVLVVVGQKPKREIENQRLAKIELVSVRDLEVLRVIVDILRQLFLNIRNRRSAIDLARLRVEKGLILAKRADADEIESKLKLRKADRHARLRIDRTSRSYA
jgi:hypothetical protein